MKTKLVVQRLCACAVTLSVMPLVADIQSGTNVFENVKAAAEGVQGAVSDAARGAAPVIVAVIGIGIALWIIPTIVGVVKRAFGSGKGR